MKWRTVDILKREDELDDGREQGGEHGEAVVLQVVTDVAHRHRSHDAQQTLRARRQAARAPQHQHIVVGGQVELSEGEGTLLD